MPGSALSDPPSVSLSFANNFWGKDDAGVTPLLERMHNAKVTGDELRSFYTSRAQIEEEYARKLSNLSRKPLGSSETGTLRMSLDVVRAEIEAMSKAHQSIAGQMKAELEDQLAAFAGGLKERRKIVQAGIEKLLKVKMQQTSAVNKARDRYEQDCLKIKGYLAQGHMVMGHEERKNKAKLEKTQIQMSTTSNEYEAAVKVLEETTQRWNREWKKACDSFQDFEEERLDFMKSSLWTFANIASTVCVSDDAALEKIRLSLEDCEVEKDITNFIRDHGTGQEIPDPPKFIDFCRGDAADDASITSEDVNYSVAQFQRTMNPAFRSSSPQPSVFESHHDPNNPLARELAHKETTPISPPGDVPPPPTAYPDTSRQSRSDPRLVNQALQEHYQREYGDVPVPKVPHNEYPTDGMTQFCRIPPPSDRSSTNPSPERPGTGDSRSEYATSFSSMEPPSGPHSPIKQMTDPMPTPDRSIQKKKSSFFQSHSPFRRSKQDNDATPTQSVPQPESRNTWSASASPTRPQYGRQARGSVLGNDRPDGSMEPADPRANFQLNVGNNVFDVASPDSKKPDPKTSAGVEDLDPIAQALAELKGVTKQTSVRMSADRYHGLATPAPGSNGSSTPNAAAAPAPLNSNSAVSAAQRGTPPPSYDQPMSRLGAPKPAHTSRQMQQTTRDYVNQTQNMFNPRSSAGSSRPATSSRGSSDVARAPSPGLYDQQQQPRSQHQAYRATSPNPYAAAGRPRAQSSSPIKPAYNSYNPSRHGSPGANPRAISPQPQFQRPSTRSGGGAASPGAAHFGAQQRPGSSRASGDMTLQLAPSGSDASGGRSDWGGSQRGGRPTGRPMSSYYGDGAAGQGQVSTRVRSKSVAEPRQYTASGREVLHYSRAMYMYQAQIAEELSFSKGDVLAVLREQDDGWWEAEVVGKQPGKVGLVPSNYLQRC
ncbi:hypothetical protein K490DRAFT_75587 [Saccharata proteae CBS 121410]|uniref:Cell division control protein n=1 Tax=Saccharata proteae CBS 121410 TaxID=1314787 RepID=A0A9P4HT25_9PEZI|nr:hypothetical protein K490DRAFT_75587 [Saccharata proteae CBS 121410]